MPSTPSTSSPLDPELWDACVQTDDEPLVGVVVDHPIPTMHFGFDGSKGEVFIAPVGTVLADAKEWTFLGHTSAEGFRVE